MPIEDIIEWDVSNWSQLITEWTPILESLNKDISVLAVGERNGGLSLWLALLGFNVLCTDREGPTALAKQRHIKYGVAHKIKYANLDIVHTAVHEEQFDLVIAKSVIGGLKDDPTNRNTRSYQVQQQAVDNIYGLLKADGYYLSAENLKGSWLLDLLRGYKGKKKGWRYLSCSEMHHFCRRFSSVDIKTFGIIPGRKPTGSSYRGSYLLNKTLNFLPSNFKYIAFTAARK